MIVAIQKKDRGIGRNNALLWHISEDLKRFKALTMGHPIIMGENTYKSIGRALPGRLNIVVTRNPDLVIEGCTVCHTLDEAFRVAAENDQKEIFVIGGGEMYRSALPFAERLYVTEVESDVEADTFFPEFGDFQKIKEEGEGENEGVKYVFALYEKS